MNIEQNQCLMARKPMSMAEIRTQIDRQLEIEDINQLVGRSCIIKMECRVWETLMLAHLTGHQWWLVRLVKEGHWVLIDTQGYNYPRYVGILSHEAATNPSLNHDTSNQYGQVSFSPHFSQ